jgi:hypothetical protein
LIGLCVCHDFQVLMKGLSDMTGGSGAEPSACAADIGTATCGAIFQGAVKSCAADNREAVVASTQAVGARPEAVAASTEAVAAPTEAV